MLYAHTHKYLDVTREIDPIIEARILRQLEAEIEIDIAKVYPIVDEDNRYYIRRDWLKSYRDCILYTDESKENKSNTDISDKIRLLKQLNPSL